MGRKNRLPWLILGNPYIIPFAIHVVVVGILGSPHKPCFFSLCGLCTRDNEHMCNEERKREREKESKPFPLLAIINKSIFFTLWLPTSIYSLACQEWVGGLYMSNQSINNNTSNEHSINNHAIVCLLSIVSYNMREPITHTHNKKQERVLNFGLLCTYYDYSHNVLLLR